MPSDPQAVLARHVTKRDIICEECLGLWPCDTAVVARALAESEERVRVLEDALRGILPENIDADFPSAITGGLDAQFARLTGIADRWDTARAALLEGEPDAR